VTPAPTYRSEAVIELPAGLRLDGRFLGLLKPAQIGGADVHVVLPGFRGGKEDWPGETVLHPRARFDWTAYFAHHDSEDVREHPFGAISNFRSGNISEIYASRLLVLPRKPLTLAGARRLKVAADDWSELLVTWVEVATRADLRRRTVQNVGEGRSAYVWTERGPQGSGALLRDEGSLRLYFGSVLDLTPAKWGRALAATSGGRRPPEAHLFLRDARQALGAGYPRRAVLDAATATELGLTSLRDRNLARGSAGLRRYVEAHSSQIGRLCEFLSLVGSPIPARISQEVGEPRNQAIHQGREPGPETAARAVAKAEEVLELAFPWRSLL
jgi:hypothetical protein